MFLNGFNYTQAKLLWIRASWVWICFGWSVLHWWTCQLTWNLNGQVSIKPINRHQDLLGLNQHFKASRSSPLPVFISRAFGLFSSAARLLCCTQGPSWAATGTGWSAPALSRRARGQGTRRLLPWLPAVGLQPALGELCGGNSGENSSPAVSTVAGGSFSSS